MMFFVSRNYVIDIAYYSIGVNSGLIAYFICVCVFASVQSDDFVALPLLFIPLHMSHLSSPQDTKQMERYSKKKRTNNTK